MADHNKDAELIDEKQALSMFFTSLLTDTQESVSIEQKTNEKKENTVFLPNIPTEIVEQEIVQAVTDVSEVIKQQEKIVEHKINNIKPSTVEARDVEEAFQIMMFKTAGLTLAVPLVELSGVITWPDTVTEMPGHKESYLGIVQHLGKKVPVIDIAQIVFPQDRIGSLIDSESQDRLQRIVFINEFEWGLACDAVNDVISIEPEQVKWRKSGTKRAWLAGTVVEHMCALLDIKELSKLLNSDYS